ncbi:MAG TPA: thiamine diphosphokinase [Ilumatobacteraceae bacterium]|nr:thiamine diphosphokinase [Ilumatobacteraceae bacterium]
MSQVVVVIGGGPLSRPCVDEVQPDAAIIAADSGLDHAVAAGLRPTLLIGDLDSITAHGKMWAYAHEVEIDQYPIDKDATDTELALRRAVMTDAADLLVLGSAGTRFDHSLGTIAALGNPLLARFENIRVLLDEVTVYVLHRGHGTDLDLPRGSFFSLLALHGACRGIDVSGAEWPLSDEVLEAWSTRGLSNVSSDLVHIAVADGVLTVVVP